VAWTTERASANELAGLSQHGDRQVPAGTLDLAVNVWPGPPAWLRAALTEVNLSGYPDPAAGVVAAAARHSVEPAGCMLLNGAAEAFWAVAYGLAPRLAACVHPSFTAPEAALRSAGVPVVRVVRGSADGFALDPRAVPEEADLVVLGRPDNPTGRYEPADLVARLTRPGRTVVVDEAFDDFLPDAAGLAAMTLPGVVCVRSLTKLWGLAGLRVGYALGPPEILARLATAVQPWPVSSLAARAVELLCGKEAERRDRVRVVAAARTALLSGLARRAVETWASPVNFVLLRSDCPDLRERLLAARIAVRRAETFPGLDAHYVRAAVSADPAGRARFLTGLDKALARTPRPT
jgi:histidinol-phosphate aminotransferase